VRSASDIDSTANRDALHGHELHEDHLGAVATSQGAMHGPLGAGEIEVQVTMGALGAPHEHGVAVDEERLRALVNGWPNLYY